MKISLRETELRRPTWKPGLWLTLADGAEWALAPTILRVETEVGPRGARLAPWIDLPNQLPEHEPYRLEFAGAIEHLARLGGRTDEDAEDARELIFRALAAPRLMSNYHLTVDEAARLLSPSPAFRQCDPHGAWAVLEAVMAACTIDAERVADVMMQVVTPGVN